MKEGYAMSEQQPEIKVDAQTPPAKITFTSEQQTKIDEIIREAQGRAGNEARATAARLQAESEVLKAELATLRGDKSGLEKESKTAKQELAKVKKQAVITEAASKHGFFDVKQISKLVGDEIVFDPDKNQFHIIGEDGSPRVGLDGSTPLSLDAFFQEFAAKNSHLVRSAVKNGVGSTENTHYVTTNQRSRLTEIFGKGSNSQKANALGVADPQLYKQMRREAKSLGIIP
jgi:predicted nuclease with TOPRIM domain